MGSSVQLSVQACSSYFGFDKKESNEHFQNFCIGSFALYPIISFLFVYSLTKRVLKPKNFPIRLNSFDVFCCCGWTKWLIWNFWTNGCQDFIQLKFVGYNAYLFPFFHQIDVNLKFKSNNVLFCNNYSVIFAIAAKRID